MLFKFVPTMMPQGSVLSRYLQEGFQLDRQEIAEVIHDCIGNNKQPATLTTDANIAERVAGLLLSRNENFTQHLRVLFENSIPRENLDWLQVVTYSVVDVCEETTRTVCSALLRTLATRTYGLRPSASYASPCPDRGTRSGAPFDPVPVQVHVAASDYDVFLEQLQNRTFSQDVFEDLRRSPRDGQHDVKTLHWTRVRGGICGPVRKSSTGFFFCVQTEMPSLPKNVICRKKARTKRPKSRVSVRHGPWETRHGQDTFAHACS